MRNVRLTERLVLLNLLSLSLISGVLNLIIARPGVDKFDGAYLLWVAATAAAPALQLLISLPRFAELQRRRRFWLFGLDLLLCFGPVLSPLHLQANSGYPIASALLLFGRRSRWALVGLLIVATSAIDHHFWPANSLGKEHGQTVIYWALNNISIGAQVYVVSKVAWVAHELHTRREEAAEAGLALERLRVRRDVHDLLGHSITLIAVYLEVAFHAVRTGPGEDELARVSELVEQGLGEIRTIGDGTPVASLAQELEAAREVLWRAGIETEITVIGRLDRADPALAYVLREAITNLLRHSRATRCVITAGPAGVTAANDGAVGAGRPAGTGLAGLGDRLRPLRGQVTGQLRDGWFTLEARVPVRTPRLGIDWSAATAPLLALVAFFSLITYVNPVTWSAGEQVELWLLCSLVISGLMIYLVVLRPARVGAAMVVMGGVGVGALGLDQIGFEHMSMIAATALFVLPRGAGRPLFALCAVAGTWSQARYTLQSGIWPGSGANAALILVLLVSQIRAQFLYWGAMRLADLVRELKMASAELTEATLAVERARSGLHLRDRIGSSLFAIARHLDRARQGDHPEGEVSEALQLARDTSEEIRSFARQGITISG
ncbi:sensor histidine kinase [Actinomadura citrea]|uniref:sensor histidine kinase n=1 Tax=Actinomadura citrea TaxID=46158 RepID=UPI003CE46F0E